MRDRASRKADDVERQTRGWARQDAAPKVARGVVRVWENTSTDPSTFYLVTGGKDGETLGVQLSEVT